jgi:hypothetical protein
MEVTFSAIPINEEFSCGDNSFVKTNNFGLSNMLCNAECVENGERVCFPLFALVETENANLLPPIFKKGDKLICVVCGDDTDVGKSYVVSCNSFFHNGEECVQLKKKSWERNPVLPAYLFEKVENKNESRKASNLSGKCGTDFFVDEREGRNSNLEQSEYVQLGADVHDTTNK